MSKEANKEKALNALLTSGSVAGAAKECGLAEKTIHRYLAEPEFLQAFRAARRSLYEATVAKMQSAGAEAVDTLIANMRGERSAATAATSTRAAQLILEGGTKGVEIMDILTRLEELEDGLKAKG